MDKPIPEFLEGWRAILQRLDDENLAVLHQRILDVGNDHPDTVAELDREVERRKAGGKQVGSL